MMISVPDFSKRAPGKDDFNLTWTNFGIFDSIIYELGNDPWTG